MRERTTLIQAEREGLRAIREAALNPPHTELEPGTRRNARKLAAKLGHTLGPITEKGAMGRPLGRCTKCLAAVVFRPEDLVANPKTGDFFGGSAVTERCPL